MVRILAHKICDKRRPITQNYTHFLIFDFFFPLFFLFQSLGAYYLIGKKNSYRVSIHQQESIWVSSPMKGCGGLTPPGRLRKEASCRGHTWESRRTSKRENSTLRGEEAVASSRSRHRESGQRSKGRIERQLFGESPLG